jgi:hypothetical protein
VTEPTSKIPPLHAELEQLRADGIRLLRRLLAIARSNATSEDEQAASLFATELLLGLSADSAKFLRTLVADDEAAKAFPQLCRHVRRIAPRRREFPILFNELSDLTPYRRLAIGYLLRESKNPKLRGGKSPFSPYALQIVRRLEYLRAEQLAIRDGRMDRFRAAPAWRRYQHDSVPNRSFRSHRDLSDEEFLLRHRIHSSTPDDAQSLTKLPILSKATAKQWKTIAKAFFKKAFPKPEEIPSLSNAINDSDIEYESQIRSQIVERVGKAVVALART